MASSASEMNVSPWELKKAVDKTKNNIGELANKLRRMLKSGVTQDNQSEFDTIATDLRSKLEELRKLCDSSDLSYQTTFNNIYTMVSANILEPNKELPTMSSLQFSFEFFTGPAEAERAKQQEEERSKEMNARFESSGFSQRDLHKLNPFLIIMNLKFLQAPAPIVEETHACHGDKCRKMHECYFGEKKHHIPELVDGLKSKYVCSTIKDSKECMMKYPQQCSTCLSLAVICMMAHPFDRDEAKKSDYEPTTDLDAALLYAGMTNGDFSTQHRESFLLTYLTVMQQPTDMRVLTLTIPNIRDAITNQASMFRADLVFALTYYLKLRNKDKRFQSEMKETEASYRVMFEEWREWFSDKKSNSTFKPYPFLGPWGV